MMSERGAWQGMLAIVRFNWPLYLVAGLGLISVSVVHLFAPTLLTTIALLGLGYFILVSLGVSHLVYDRSDLYRFDWLDEHVDLKDIERVLFCHSGFDESSEILKARIPSSQWTVLDHYDRVLMTEASIRRARALYPASTETVRADFSSWPIESHQADLVLGVLAIHELRTEKERASWFCEARRSLSPRGKVIIVEHVRDFANFLAFGPGFLHFHSVKSWTRSWEAGGLRLVEQGTITPWVRIFVLASDD